MIEIKERYKMPVEDLRRLCEEFSVTEPQVRNTLNLKYTGKFAQYILKRAIELGAKKQKITIETEE